jgi:hypothetical protein
MLRRVLTMLRGTLLKKRGFPGTMISPQGKYQQEGDNINTYIHKLSEETV